MPYARLVLIALVSFAIVAGGAAVAAQEATPIAEPETMTRVPAHVHAGTCDEPGEVFHPLADAEYGSTRGNAEVVGPDVANAAMVSVTNLAASLDQLVAGEHAIDVHRAGVGDEAATRIACGAIGGFRTGDDLIFGLAEVNGSRYGGTAWLHDEGGETIVTLFLVSGLAHGIGDVAAATPVAATEAPSDLPPAAEVAAAVIEDGVFTTSVLNLVPDAPTVLHVVNLDDRPYHFRISDGLVSTTPLPAKQLTVVEFTTPSAGAYAALLLEDADNAVGLDLIPVTVE